MQSTNLELFTDGWANALRADCDSATASIHIAAMSMVPPRPNASGLWPDLFASWRRAVARGVAVKIFLAAPQQIPAATKGNRGSGDALVRAGIDIHFVRGTRLLHTKCAIVDGSVLWVGSGNLTGSAMSSNHEAFLRALCPAAAAKMLSVLEHMQ